MVGSVIVRGETTIVDQIIHHDDQPLSWDQADRRAGFRLDRRKAWAFVEGRLCESIGWSQACSGCAYGFEDRGGGCSECGYHGRVRNGMWIPFATPSPQSEISRLNPLPAITRLNGGES